VLYGGRLAELGPTAAVLQHPDHPYTAGLLASRLSQHSRRGQPLPTIPGEPPDPRAPRNGCAFAPRCALAGDLCDVVEPVTIAAPGHDGLVACHRAGEEQVALVRVRDQAVFTSPVVDGDGGNANRPALRLRGIRRVFGKKKTTHVAVAGLDLDVPTGGAVALVGESGCGKTTTLRIAVGLDRPDTGTVEVGEGGRPQLVFQDAGASLTPWMTVGELLDERLRAEGLSGSERRRRIIDALGVVGLPAEVAACRPRMLSGGQRQRVSIARAVAVPPALLACDEPISALDVSLAATVLNLLNRLRAEFGMALLFVTHDLAAARYIGDRVAVMDGGCIVEEGDPDDVLGRPTHERTRSLVASLPTIPTIPGVA
jgi:peptide/nickel transport system ATP-binding protein